MKMIDVIATKRSGKKHTKEEIEFLIKGTVNGSIPDYQIASWLMAVCLNGMDFDETYNLTQAMANSGDIIDLSSLGTYIVDKHSTGGVGDKTTLVLIPLLAATGIPIAKLSGRGLGFSGGTIDKLEAIKGFNAFLSNEAFIEQARTVKAAIGCQTANLAPADKIFYELRDVTGTIDSIPLIASSVLSKKFAAGANTIVIDVKCGSGAFMKTFKSAKDLSTIMSGIGKKARKKVICVITSMEQPLGNAIGNGIEVFEAIQALSGKGPDDLVDLCLYLGGIILCKTKKARNIEDGKMILQKYINDGSALQKFKEMVKAQGGELQKVNNPQEFFRTEFIIEFISKTSGYVSKLDALTVAKAGKALGTGREKKGDSIDYTAGILLNKKIGDKVTKDELLATIYANSMEQGKVCKNILKDAYKIFSKKIRQPKLLLKLVE